MTDDGLDWLRDIRSNIAAKFGNDPHRLGDHLREMEKLPQYAHRIVRVRKVLEAERQRLQVEGVR